MKTKRGYSHLLVAGALVTAALLPLSCTKKSDPQVLARVGSSEIRAEQFQEQMVRRGGARLAALDKNALLQEMVEQEALYVRALNAGMGQDPELQRAWRNLVVGKLKERELAPRLARADVTQEELQAAYAAESQRYLRPAAVRLAVLYLKIDPVTRSERITEIQQRMAEARQKVLGLEPAGAPGFGALAITCSEDQATRYNGGIVGWVEKNRGHAWLAPTAIDAGFDLKDPGEVSPVITDSKGVYLLKLLDRRPETLRPLAEVETALRPRLLSEKRRQIEQDFIRESLQSIPVVVHPELLARIPVPASRAVAENKPPPPPLP